MITKLESQLLFFPLTIESETTLDREKRAQESRVRAGDSNSGTDSARIKCHEESAGRRDHGDREPGTRVGFGTPDGLTEVVESLMHVKTTIADPQQDCRTQRVGNTRHREVRFAKSYRGKGDGACDGRAATCRFAVGLERIGAWRRSCSRTVVNAFRDGSSREA